MHQFKNHPQNFPILFHYSDNRWNLLQASLLIYMEHQTKAKISKEIGYKELTTKINCLFDVRFIKEEDIQSLRTIIEDTK